jgi:transposase
MYVYKRTRKTGRRMDLRELKGLEIAARTPLFWEAGFCDVPSQSGDGKYKVQRVADGFVCTCEDYQLRQQPCKHIIAAQFVLERDGRNPRRAIDTESVPKRPTYRQAWSSYNLAQSIEKHRFQVLLHDLCRYIEEPPPPKCGRRPHLVKDAIFAMTFKVYGTFSSRRFSCDLADAHEKGFLSRLMPGLKLPQFFENPDFTPVLQALIIQSSLPLKTVETTFATDSTGFSTSRFTKWFDIKYGVHRTAHHWVKAHAICGTKTNIVTNVLIFDRDAGDSPQFKPLVQTTAENFTVREVSGDKAYLSHENLAVVDGLGGTPFVPFKSNSTPGEPGSLWSKMHAYYSFRREEFLQHYHLRSNAESTFAMLKAKFRDHVRSKTDVAMKNEVLAKFLAHNLCVLIQSQCELGIEPVFWQEEPTGKADVLPLHRPG